MEPNSQGFYCFIMYRARIFFMEITGLSFHSMCMVEKLPLSPMLEFKCKPLYTSIIPIYPIFSRPLQPGYLWFHSSTADQTSIWPTIENKVQTLHLKRKRISLHQMCHVQLTLSITTCLHFFP